MYALNVIESVIVILNVCCIESISCQLFGPVPGLTACSVQYDYMHSKLLGSDMVFHGSCLWLLCYASLPNAPKANLEICWKDILSTYKEKGIVERYRGMTKRTLFNRKKGGPKLKGRAAQIQAFAQPMQALWSKHALAGVEFHRKIQPG